MDEKKRFTREEKIVFFTRLIVESEIRTDRYKRRLAWLMSDKYQDWNSDVAKELESKKGPK